MYGSGIEIPKVSFSTIDFSEISSGSYFIGFNLDNSGVLSKIDNTGAIIVIEGGDPSIVKVGSGIYSTHRINNGNFASGYNSTAFGKNNTASGYHSNISGGVGNTASGVSVVGGGANNTSSNYYSTISGGYNNTSSSSSTTVGGGQFNISSNNSSTISGGIHNIASGRTSTISGGCCNTSSCNFAAIGGGAFNLASGYYSMIGGGKCNSASSYYSTINGGCLNVASGCMSTIQDGFNNTASGRYSTISNGYRNTASSYYSTVITGRCNVASNELSMVVGGNQNSASGLNSTILGGSCNFATCNYSGIFGCNITSVADHTFHINNLVIATTPVQDQNATAYLVRDTSTGIVKYKSISSPNYGLYSQTTTGPSVTGIVEQSIIGTGVGTLVIPANAFSVGDSFTCALDGSVSSLSSATIHIHVKTLSGVILADTGIVTMAATTNKPWLLNLFFTVRTLGGPGTASISSGGLFSYIRNGGTNFEGYVLSTINTTTFDTTVDNTLVITAQWNTGSESNTIQSYNFVLTKVY